MSLRKYTNPDQRNIRQEKEIFEFISECGIEHNSVYLMGAELIWLSYGKTGLLPESIIEKYSCFFDKPNQSIFSPDNVRKLVLKFSEQIKTIQSEITIVKSLTDFFNENIRDVLPSELFTTYTFTIMNSLSAAEQISVINRLLDEAGAYNDNKTGAGSHDTNEVYNWLVEVRRGGL